jgi:glycosyltransferase involved in cell wall biosynthesis
MLAISVVMSVFKEPLDWIELSINSIRNQSFSDFEFIIVNDNIDDISLKSLLRKLQNIDPRIIILENHENLGLTKSLNRALSIAKGKYIARMDADDISFNQRFQIQFDYLEDNRDYILVGGQNIIIDTDGVEISKKTFPIEDSEIKNEMYYRPQFSHPTLMIKRVLPDTSLWSYDENFKFAQDYELAVQLSEHGKFKNIDKDLLKYRKSKIQIGKLKRKEQKQHANITRLRYINKNLNKVDGTNFKEDSLKYLPYLKVQLKKNNCKMMYKHILCASGLHLKNLNVKLKYLLISRYKLSKTELFYINTELR